MRVLKYQSSTLENKLNSLYARKLNEIRTKTGYEYSFSKYLRVLLVEKKLRIELDEAKILKQIDLYDVSYIKLEELINEDVLDKLKKEYYLKEKKIDKFKDKAIRKIDNIMDDVVLYDLPFKDAIILFEKYLGKIEMSMG